MIYIVYVLSTYTQHDHSFGSLRVHGYGQISQIWPYLAYLAISMHYQTTRMYVHDGYLWKVHQNYRSLLNFLGL